MFFAPGTIGIAQRSTLQYARQIRDELMWEYPVLPGAIMIYQQMATGREWKIAGRKATQVARAVEWINSATTRNYDGTIDIGFEQFLKRRVLDYLAVGRTAFTASLSLEYLDPCDLSFYYASSDSYWQYLLTGQVFYPNQLYINHPIPVGGRGKFISPVSKILPTAMLAWLVREHDRASADGRKINDIIVVGSQALAESMKAAVEHSLSLWTSANVDFNSRGVPMVYVDNLPQGIKMSEMIHRLGLAEIPESFNRDGFMFSYVNEIASVLGLSLRHFYNAEKATNRALEEVQEARQQVKGPNTFVRTEERLLNNPNVIQRFGENVRFGFVEEMDAQSQQTRAMVLKLYSESLKGFAEVFGGSVNGDAFLAWLQSEDILPPDLELITNLGTLNIPSRMPTQSLGAQEEGRPRVDALGSADKKSITELDYDEIVMNQHGKIVERRFRVFGTVERIQSEILQDKQEVEKLTYTPPQSFEELLNKARFENWKQYKETHPEEKPFDQLDQSDHDRILRGLTDEASSTDGG